MIKHPNSLFISGINYQGTKLIEYANTLVKNSDWQKNIGLFLLDWLDNKEYITVNSSGSTGKPKEIMLSKQLMLASAQNTIKKLSLHKETKAFMCLPAKYISGKMMIVRAMVGKWNLIAVEPVANPLLNLEVVSSFNFATLTPLQLYEIVLHDSSKKKLNSFQNIIIGGSSINDILLNDVKFLNTKIYESYGMTETASHIAIKRINGENSSNVFSAMKGVTFSLDQRDCLVIHWKNFLKYPIITNDVVRLFDNKHFGWIGRIDNVINSGGIKLFAEEIEKKILSIINIPFYISSKSDDKYGQYIILIVEGSPWTKEFQAIFLQECNNLLGKYEIPKEFRFVNQFERTETGKIIRKLI